MAKCIHCSQEIIKAKSPHVCFECSKKLRTIWRNKPENLIKTRQRSLEWYRNNTEKVKRNNSKKRLAQKLKVINHYGGKCACCGETNHVFLAIDHINGNGKQHRKIVGKGIIYWLEKNNYPEGFRILCHNCNMALGLFGYCPHGNLPNTACSG